MSKKKEEKDSAARKTARYAGAALTGLGVLGAIKGRPMLRYVARRARGEKNYGKDLSDYIEAGQTGMNEGITGKLIGKHLEKKAAKVGSKKYLADEIKKEIIKAKKAGKSTRGIAKSVRDRVGMENFGISHYRRFRSGHREALKHYDWETGLQIKNSRARKGRGGELLSQDKKTGKNVVAKVAGTKGQRIMAIGRKKLMGDRGLIQKNLNAGMNEKEAIRSALTSNDKDIKAYAKYMVAAKSQGAGSNPFAGENAYRKYAALALAGGPGAMAAGGALTGASYIKARDKKNKKKK